MATNSSPLPKNTDAKNRSSRARSGPHHPDEPQEGDAAERHQIQRDRRGRAIRSIGQPRAFRGGIRGAERRRTTARPNSSENTMPAAAAARGVRRPVPVADSW